MENSMKTPKEVSIEEFVDMVDELCFKYKYEIHPCVPRDNEVPHFEVSGNGQSMKFCYIDGDGISNGEDYQDYDDSWSGGFADNH